MSEVVLDVHVTVGSEFPTAQNDNLSIHEDKTRGVYVKGLSDVYVGSGEEVYEVLKAGGASRAVSSTSRSYARVRGGQYILPVDHDWQRADLNRHERRVFPITLHRRHWHTSTQRRERESEVG